MVLWTAALRGECKDDGRRVQRMSLTAVAWFTIYLTLALMAVTRPIWGVSLYMFSYFLTPNLWWWGRGQEWAYYPWNMTAGFVLLGSVLLHGAQPQMGKNRWSQLVPRMAVLMYVNATLVHLGLAADMATSLGPYVLYGKFLLLFFLLLAAIQSPGDLRILLITLALGAGYIGYEVTINERGSMSADRLRDIGCPGASDSNSLAALLTTILPLIGSLLYVSALRDAVLVVVFAPMILNVVLACNSRGALLAAIGSAAVLCLLARGPIRKLVLTSLGLGGLATLLLLGDPEIIGRFATVFTDPNERDRSAASRIEFWKAGSKMVADYPLGSGGDGFKRVRGHRYRAQLGADVDRSVRAVHNGFINDACEWGVQGLMLRLSFIFCAGMAAYQTMKYCLRHKLSRPAFLGACILAGMMGFLGSSMFIDYLNAEWGFWIAAVAVRYSAMFYRQ